MRLDGIHSKSSNVSLLDTLARLFNHTLAASGYRCCASQNALKVLRVFLSPTLAYNAELHFSTYVWTEKPASFVVSLFFLLESGSFLPRQEA